MSASWVFGNWKDPSGFGPGSDTGPLRGELLSVEHLEERARVLAASYTLARNPRQRPRRFLPRLHENARVLRRAYQVLATDVRRGEAVAPAAEWLLDNFHLIETEILEVRKNLPQRYYLDLPKLAVRDLAGMARVHAMALEFIRHSDARFDLHRLTRFVSAYQMVAPLTLGELWAWPSMLKLCLIENLRRLTDEIMESRMGEGEADLYFARFEATAADAPLPALPEMLSNGFVVQLVQRTRELGARISELRIELERRVQATGFGVDEAVRAEHQRQTMGQASMGNSITGLRLVSTTDWNRAIERVSLMEQVLQRDPAGVYGRMDFRSRDRYRQAVEELSDPTGEAQLRVALRAVESARQVGREEDPAGHIGYHLIGGGRRDFELDVAYVPHLKQRIRRFIFRHSVALYLGSISLFTALGVSGATVYARSQGAPDSLLPWIGLLALLPLSQLASSIVQKGVHRVARPRRLPRVDLPDGVPEEGRTMVVVPTLLASAESARAQIEHLEVQALGNSDPHLHFALLTDYPDSTEAERPQDAHILTAAIQGIQELNTRHGNGRQDRFYLFHRPRQWNPRQGVWMGWERKRGKIEEFNALLRGATNTSFHIMVGDRSILEKIRYVITLDADTRLPRDAAAELVGVIRHPLNRAHFDPRLRRVTSGYGILQPRVSVTMSSAAGSLFARVYAGHTGVDPYTTAVSDTYQDLFGEGIFTGKGLYDVDAFTAALEGRVPENALLSHDLFEGIYARTGLVSDVELVDDFPSSVLAHARRQRRWVRGDWQILSWLFPWVPTRRGLERNRLPLISRWKILDNLRRSLVAPSTLALLASAWTWLPGPPWAWTLAVVGAMSFPILPQLWRGLMGPAEHQPWGVFLRDLREEIAASAAQVLLELTLLAYHSYEMAHAIGLTLVRLILTQRMLLEWETAASSAARSAGLTVRQRLRAFANGMWASPAVALTLLAATLAARPAAIPTALPLLLLWLVAPLVAFWLSRPALPRAVVLDLRDREYLREVARTTWKYFEASMDDAVHWLPPDNIQEKPARVVADRTSPTNIGMALLSTLSAHDLGFIDAGAALERIERTITTVEALEKHEGHLLNWYNIRSLAPLQPRYVSTVDSANLAGSLLAVAAGLRRLPTGPGAPDGEGRRFALADRAVALANAMSFTFLYDRDRRMFSIGFRLPDMEGPGRLDTSFYDLLASEARLASFIAIAKGEIPQEHWFQLGRGLVSVGGVPTLVSWSGSMFEYLMPLLIMRSYPETLLHHSCRAAVRAQIAYGKSQGVPWGISESAFNLMDRHGTYQYKAFGVPELGLKRGLSEDLVIAPYASALAAMVDPSEAVANLRRLAREGAQGDLGFYDALDYTPRDAEKPPDRAHPAGHAGPAPVEAFFAHHQGMTVVALANVILPERMVSRFHADARIQATELLLQERVPRFVPLTRPRPIEVTRVAPPIRPLRPRRFRTPDTLYPHAAILSNGRYVSVLTNAGGGSSSCRGLSVTRQRQDPVCDPGSNYLYLRDVRSGAAWSATYQPMRRAPDEYRTTLLADKAVVQHGGEEIDSLLEIAVSPEDDVEVRRLSLTNRSAHQREIEITSYVEVVLAPPAEDLAHPVFGKLFLETEVRPETASLLCGRRKRSADEPGAWAIHVLSLEGRPQSAVEWETDRMRFLGRGRGPDDPIALDGRPLSGTTGATLDPILSLRQRIRLAPGGFARLAFATGMASDRDAAIALCMKYADPTSAPRTFALAATQLSISLRHLGISIDEAQLFERLASRVLYADRSLGPTPEVLQANTLGQAGLWSHGISGDFPILLLRVLEGDDLSLARQVLRAQDYWRLKGLSVDVVILNEHPVGYRNEMHEQIGTLLEGGPWGAWKNRPGGAFLLTGDGMSDSDRNLLLAAARATLRGDGGSLQEQLDRPYAEPEWPSALEIAGPSAGAPEPDETPEIETPELTHWNGRGGFTPDGKEYVIVLNGAEETPLPWANVLANPRFGTVVTAAGPSYTWSENSRENRLTPFA
ncbi:MAG TPA: glucoamylase family protein, partial [Candidatus Binatia bacterium]|nr:glucoamylase family protein [Candidatus Binatia bacterium]